MNQGFFDWQEGERRKQEGINRAAEAKPTTLELARGYAVQHCIRFGTVTADDVALWLHDEHDGLQLGPAAGALFRGGLFEFTGQMVPSQRPRHHRHYLRVWRLRTDETPNTHTG